MPNKSYRQEPTFLDANLLIRFFTNDDSAKADSVENLLKKAKKDELAISDVLVAEIVWVLLSFYKLNKDEILEKLEGLLTLRNLKLNRLVLKQTLDFWQKHNISFVDAYLCAVALKNGNHAFYSFDQALDKIKEIKRLEP